MEYFPIDAFEKSVSNLASLIANTKTKEEYEYISGINRGGVLLAYALSIKLGLPLLDFRSLETWKKTNDVNENINFSETDIHKVLLCDDIIDSGKTIDEFPENDVVVLFLSDNYKRQHFMEMRNAVHHIGTVASIPIRKISTISKKENRTIFYSHVADEWINFFWEEDAQKDAESLIRRQIEFIGEDPNREGLIETPKRIVSSWKELFVGYNMRPEKLIKTFDRETYDEIVLLKDIQLYSMCEHHMLPFVGKAHVAYIPNKRVIGISKLARIVDCYARRLQIQERIGTQVTNFLMQNLLPLGAACIIEAEHYCMRMRGCSQQDSTMITSSLKGAFKEKPEARAELMELIKR